MAASHIAPQRPRARRIAHAIIVATMALIVVPFTVAAMQKDAAALRWWPLLASARADLAGKLLAANPTDRATIATARTLAAGALRASPISAEAARSLGLAAVSSGDTRLANAAFDYAFRLSRRDVPTHLWFIERSVERGDIAAALRHYDQAMRTSLSSRALLTPILVAAAQDDAVVDQLLPLLARRPNWWGAFVHMMIGTSPDAAVLHRFATSLNLRSDDRDHPDFLPRTIDRLVNAGLYDRAFELYARDSGTPATQLLRNGGFENPNPRPPLDWRYAEEPDLEGLVQARPDGRGTALFLSAQAGRGGTVAQQLLRLAPGDYRLSLLAGAIADGSATDRPRITLRCANGQAPPIAEVILPPARENGRRIAARFAVRRGCIAQRLTVDVRGSLSETSDTLPWIDDLAIGHVRG